MSQKIMLSSRLSPELIDEINAQAAAHNCDVDSLLSIALDSLKRIERGDVQLSDRVEKMQIIMDKKFAEFTSAVTSLVNTLSQMIPIMISAEDRAFRAHTNARLSLAYNELMTEVKGVPTQKMWDDTKTEVAEALKKERESRRDQ